MIGDDKKTGIEVGTEEDAPDFIERWSRRKAEAAARSEEGTQSVVPATVDASESAEVPEPPALLTDADMPAVDSLAEDADVSGFLSPGVSDGLRRAALRKLFHSPKFNVCDGLDDYCGDYTKFEPLGDIITADMRFQMERALERLAEADDGEEEIRTAADDEPGSGTEESVGDPVDGDSANDPSIPTKKDDEHDV